MPEKQKSKLTLHRKISLLVIGLHPINQLTNQEMRQLSHQDLDRIAIERYGIPSLILMENAGRGIAELAARMLKKRLRKVLVVSGKGNNGGDGFVAARHLANQGFPVKVILLAHPKDLKADPEINFNILRKMKIPIVVVTSPRKLRGAKRVIEECDLIVDAIFGVGLKRSVSGLFYDVIFQLNASKKQILAVDIPSGLDGDSGKVLGIAVRARATGTLGVLKRGLCRGEGRKLAGKVTVLDISIPKKLLS